MSYSAKDDYPKERQVSDNKFQKIKWKHNRILIGGWNHNIDEMTDWVVENTTGEWHFKENFSKVKWGNRSTGKEANITFWFELDADASYFKLRWL